MSSWSLLFGSFGSLFTLLLLAISRGELNRWRSLKNIRQIRANGRKQVIKLHTFRIYSEISIPILLVAPVIVSIIVNVFMGLTVVILELSAALALQRWSVQRDRNKYQQDLICTLDDMSRSLRAGAGLIEALIGVSSSPANRVEEDIRLAVRGVMSGNSLDESLSQWQSRRAENSVDVVVAAMCLGSKQGGMYSHIFDQVIFALRQSRRIADAVNTHSQQAKTSAIVLTVVPFVIAAALALFSAEMRGFILSDVGSLIVLVSTVLDVIGAYSMLKLIENAQP